MRFEKVSRKQWNHDVPPYLWYAYDNIVLPHRSTALSAGYDFFIPYTVDLDANESRTLYTGIKVELDNDKFLLCVPRSSLGFNFGLRLMNTVGVIDADYYQNQRNEGHIMAKVTNGDFGSLLLGSDKAFMQGIILPYFKVDGDNNNNLRTGGVGSTDG